MKYRVRQKKNVIRSSRFESKMTIALIARWAKVAKNSATRFQTHCPAIQLYIVIRASDAAACTEIRKKPVALASNQHTRTFLPRSLAMMVTHLSSPLDSSVESEDSPG